MPVSRPLNKTLLKKLFLKTLNEHLKPDGKYYKTGHSDSGIINRTLPTQYGLDRLTEEELRLAARGVYELERDDYILYFP